MNKINISVVILASNSEATIKNTLNSLKNFDDVVVYINNSTDDTLKISKSFNNVNIVNGEFRGFGWSKNKAATFAKYDWILSLDSDEVLSKDFVKNLQNLTLDKKVVYRIYRVNFYKDYEIKHCWGDEKIERLYHRKVTSFTNDSVHERIITNNLNIKDLKGKVFHYPYSSIEQFVEKANRYSTLFAKNNVGKKSSSPTKAFFNSIYSFIKTYIFKKGFLDGYVGLVIAYSHAVTNFYKYIKLYELNLQYKKVGEKL